MIFIFIILIISFIFVIYDNIDLKNKISSLESNVRKAKDNESNNKKCTFTKTLRVIDILDYEGTVPEEKFVLVDSFQSFNPFVLKLDINDNVKEELYYEFTFKGNKDMYTNNDPSLNNFNILSIKETNKEGLLQIQEVCE
jgi:hypothetical protein